MGFQPWGGLGNNQKMRRRWGFVCFLCVFLFKKYTTSRDLKKMILHELRVGCRVFLCLKMF